MKLVIRQIIETKGDYSQVVVSREVFEAVNGFRPSLPYTTSRSVNAEGIASGLRIFTFDDNDQLFVRYNKDDKRTIFVVKKDVATKNLLTLEQERENEPVLDIDF